MKLKLLDATAVANRLRRIIPRSDTIQIAVAWGYNGSVAELLVKHAKKIRSLTIGVSYCQTDPGLIEQLVGIRNSYVARPGGGTFHPKIYYFESEGIAEVIVGSSNFTSGGLGRNWEACVYSKGPRTDPFFKQIRSRLESYRDLRQPITAEVASLYRLQADAAKRFRKPPNPVLPGKGLEPRQLSSPLVLMSWPQYIRELRSRGDAHLPERLALLRRFQAMFSRVRSFSQMNAAEWKAVAGIIGEREKITAGLSDQEWGWFGSMKGAGEFNRRIANQSPQVAQAVDSIPRHGEITRTHYEQFCENFAAAFAGASRKGGVPTASRLLAMKRPDTFVCISEPNRSGLASALAFPPSSLSLENYWERVVEPLQTSKWYNAPRPAGRDAEIWDSRAALLDTIYYAPGS